MSFVRIPARFLLLAGLSLAAACGGSDGGDSLAGSGPQQGAGGGGAGGGSSCGQLAVCCAKGSLSATAAESCLSTAAADDSGACTAALAAYVGAGVCSSGQGGSGGAVGGGGKGGAAAGGIGAGGNPGQGGAPTTGHGGAAAGTGGTPSTGGTGVGGIGVGGTAGSGAGGTPMGGIGGTAAGEGGAAAGGASAGAGGDPTGAGGTSTAGSGGTSEGGSSAGGQSQGGGGSSSGAAGASTGGGGTSAGTSGSGGSGGSGGGCAPTLDLFIMMDQSGSMSDTVANGQTKWDAVKEAIAAFVADSSNFGTSVGIQFFGQPPTGGPPASCLMNSDCVVGGVDYGPCVNAFPPVLPGTCQAGMGATDSCNPTDYSSPYVEIQPLPGVASMINAAMDAHSPTTSTPTEPALRGLIKHVTDWQLAHPKRVAVGILATDGIPTECTVQDGPGLQMIASDALSGSPKIRTAVIGILGGTDDPTILDDIATGGGTANICPGPDAACILDTNDPNHTVASQFEAALQAIQAQTIGCH